MIFIEKFRLKVAQHEIKPIDAKVDRVWKAIPGYNGLNVNIKDSYQNMKAKVRLIQTRLYTRKYPKCPFKELISNRSIEEIQKNLWCLS